MSIGDWFSPEQKVGNNTGHSSGPDGIINRNQIFIKIIKNNNNNLLVLRKTTETKCFLINRKEL
jgi:hypothetical protein